MGIDPMTTRRAAAAASVAALLLAGCATTPDLATFLERRATCDHFRGEVPDPPDPQRMREVLQGIAESCTGTDAQLAALKRRYRDDPVVMKQLEALEPQVEMK
jgi:hypothetical protein